MVNYEKLYHRLVARVDDAIQYMVYDINDPRRMIQTAEMLRNSLQEAEESYLRDGDET